MIKFVLAALLLFAASFSAAAQGYEDPVKVIAAQREAMKPLGILDGTWRGPAWSILPNGEKRHLTQTERVGPFLDGSVKVIEGKGYEADGRVGFNSFATISYDAAKKVYNLRSYAQGRSGDFVLKPTADGLVWDIPAGPMIIRHTITIKDGVWREVGHHILPGKDPVQVLEINLKRIGDSDWPAAGAVSPK
jgi:hypothetical protein